MAGGATQFLTLLFSSSRSSLLKPCTPLLYNPIKNYGQGIKEKQSRLMEERAPSTAEEFLRVAEEKANETQNEKVVSQTIDKAFEGVEEATKGNSNIENVKDRIKDHKP